MSTGNDVTVDTTELERRLDRLGGEVLPKAIADSLTSTAFLGFNELKKNVDQRFDRPTTFTQRAFRVQKASYKSDPIEAQVSILSQQSKYLGYQVFGGVRSKSGGYATTGGGVLLPVRGGVKLDRYGNIPQGPKRFLGTLETKFKGAFVLRTRSGFLGVFQRTPGKGRGSTSTIKLLAAFKESVQYQADKFPFYEIVREQFESNFRREFDERFLKAVR